MATKIKMLQAAAGADVSPEGAWDLSYAYYNPPADLVWNVSTAFYKTQFSFAAKETSPFDIFISPDGVNMYTIGYNGVHQYSLSTAWLVTGASFVRTFAYSSLGDAFPEGLFFNSDGTKMYVVGEQYKAIREFNLSTAWDISTASYLQNFSVIAQQASPRGVYFKPDGTKMYVTGSVIVSEYNLSTAWSVSTASFVQSFNTSAQENGAKAGVLRPDGTKLYVIGTTGDDVNEYDLSTAWDISTASFLRNYIGTSKDSTPTGLFFKPDGLSMYISGDGNNAVWQYGLGGFSVTAQETVPTGIFFKPEGDKMYIIGSTGDDVNEYDLAQVPPFSVAAQETGPNSVFFKPDGTKMYVIGQGGLAVNEYDLSTAWGASTAVYLQNFSVSAQEVYPEGIFFKPDGTKMYVIGQNGDDVNEYNLSTAWNVSTSVYSQNFSVASQQTLPTGIFFKPDGTKMYVIGSQGNDDVTEYDLSAAWDISTSVFLQNFSVNAQDTNPEGVFFKPDGTKMYIAGNTGNDINEYSLSTAWDISTSVYSQSFDVSPRDVSPSGLSFKPDGTRMFVIGQQFDSVNEYDLSAAWDVSTAALVVDPEKYFDTSTAIFLQSFSVAAQDATPQNLFFKPDGTKMYTLGAANNRDVSEYNLSTAWNVSTASHSQNFSVNPQEVSPKGLFFKSEGDKMYIIGTSGDDVNEYDLSAAWDITTASYLQNFSVSAQDGSPQDVFFKPDGTKMYVLGNSGDDVNEYDLSTAWDISTSSFNQLFGVANQTTAPTGVFFKPDGVGMFIVGSTSDMVYTYSLGVQE